MKNDTSFVRIGSGDHLRDSKMSEKTPRLSFNELQQTKWFSQNERRSNGRSTKGCLNFFSFPRT